MAHLIDANCFIQAKDSYYGFDFCPGFWQWLNEQNTLGILFSIDRIGSELTCLNDDLATWAGQKGSSFFLPVDSPTLLKYAEIAVWVTGADFKAQAKPDFLNVADPFLIAYALAHGHTVVTHELYANPNQKNKVKIPNVCLQFGVPHMTIFDLLRNTGVRLHM